MTWIKTQDTNIITFLAYIYRILNKHLGCLLVLTIINNVTMNMGGGADILFKLGFLFPLYTFLVLELLDYTVILFFDFMMILHITYNSSCTNLQSHQQCTRNSFSTPALVISCFLDDGHYNKHERIPYCDFNIHFPNDQ